MDFSNFMYYIRSGVNDAKHNSAMSVSSIVIVIAGMCILGIYSVISMNVSYISAQLCDQYSVTAYIEKGTPEDRGEEIRQEISEINGVKSVEYITEVEALEQCREMFGENADFLDGLTDDNPLRGSMVVTINDITKSQTVSEQVEKVIDVVWVKDDSELADKLVASTAFIRHASLLALLIFLGIALFIISNTIRITILAKQNDIHTMRYLGATNKFIIIPFVIEGIIIGLIGAVIAYIITVGCYAYISGKLLGFMNDMIHIYGAGSVALPLLAEYVLSGIVIGGLSSVFSLVKYMRV